MTLMTARRLKQELVGAADLLRSGVDVLTSRDIISALLVLKRASDQPSTLHVSDHARWQHIAHYGNRAPGQVLNEALWELTRRNPDVLGGVMETLDFEKSLGSTQLQALIGHFDHIPLGNNNLEFSDVIGRAYDEVLGRFADQAGKMGGETYTPPSVVRLMVDLVRPEEGQSVYDPFLGSGSMLIQAREYVGEHGGDDASLSLFGQELNATTWSIARMNLLLHGVTDASVLCGDTLAEPLHLLGNGQLRRFDRVLANPPFSMKYVNRKVTHLERMKYGWHAQNGDLMNVQHVLSVLHPDGVGAVVTPHGVLFRGGMDAQVRRGIVEDYRLEAVIGIGPNVFHGTAIPACILVLRGDGTPTDEASTVLFINAEREVVTGRTQNRLEPQHIEKIVGAFREQADIPGFSRVVTRDEIADNEFNLSIRRYVDAAPPAGPMLDVRAALFGGVPRREVEQEGHRFRVFGIDPGELLTSKDPDYFGFPSEGCEATAERIQSLAAPNEQRLIGHCQRWWIETGEQITELAGTRQLLALRSRLMASFREQLLPLGILDQYQLAGVFAAWWFDRRDDLRSLDYRGFRGVIDRWAGADGRSSHLQDAQERERVLEVFGEDLRSRVERLVAAERKRLVDLYRSWSDRYATPLAELEKQNEATARRLKSRLRALGFT